MKSRMRVIGWLIAFASLNGMGCGGGDDSTGSPGAEFDGAAEADVARPDGGRAGDADAATTSKDGNDERLGADATGNTSDSRPDRPSADAPRDTSLVDGSETGGGDGSGDALSRLESSADGDVAANSDGANGPDAPDAAVEDADAFAGSVDAAPDVTPDANDESHSDAEPDASDVVVADSDGPPPEMVHWNIDASPPECSADPSAVACGDLGDFFQVSATTPCPTQLSMANLFFQGGAIPAAGTFAVHPAASLADVLALTGTEVAVQLTRSGNPTESWWGQSGTVDVQVVGNSLVMDFSGISAFEESNNSRTTTLGGFLICTP